MLNYLKFKLAKFLIGLPLVRYAPGESPETWLQTWERRAQMADTVAELAWAHPAGFRPSDAAALVTAVWYRESALEYHVHAGNESHLGPQDNGRARCVGQIHWWPGNTLLTREEWLALPGITAEATERCAAATLSYLWHHAQQCLRRDVPAVDRWDEPLTESEARLLFAAYGAGYCAQPKSSTELRVRTYKQALRAIDDGYGPN